MSGRDQFHRAARDSNLDLLKEATRKDCNGPDEDGMTPTLYASHCGNLDALRLLVGRGGDPDKCDHYGNTALHCAAANGHLACVSFLVNFGSNLCSLDNDFHTAKEVAAINQKDEVLRYLDQVIAKQLTVNPKLLEKQKEKAVKDTEKRVKNYSKLQKKANRRAEKDEKYMEKQRKKMTVSEGKPKTAENETSGDSGFSTRKDSRLLYVSPKFSDIVNTAAPTKKGLGAVSKRVQLKKQDSADFKVREVESSGKKSVRSLSGLRRDSEIMYVPKEDDPLYLNQNRRHMKDVFDSNSNISCTISEPDLSNKRGMTNMGVSEPSSIFERPGFGSVAFRNSITTTLLSLPSMTASEQEIDEEDEDGYDRMNDSIGSAGSLHQRTHIPVPWDQSDLNLDDDQDDEDSSPLILFFAAHGLIEYVPVFTQEKIDLEALMLLTEEDLKDLGLQLGPRKKLFKAIEQRRTAMDDPGEVEDSML